MFTSPRRRGFPRETLRASPARRRRRAPARAAPIFLSAACWSAAAAALPARPAAAARPPARRRPSILRPATCCADRLEPRAVLLERVAQRALRRRERERDAIAGDLDLLRLRDDRVVEHALRLADLGEERVLEVAAPVRPASASTADGARRSRPRLRPSAPAGDAGAATAGARWRTPTPAGDAARRAREAGAAERAGAGCGAVCERRAQARRRTPLPAPAIRSSIGTSLRRWIHRSSAISR